VIHKSIAIAAWICLIFIIYATLSSIGARPQLTGAGFYKAFFTVVERIGAYFVLGVLFYLAYPQNIGRVCTIVLGGAIILELMQNFVPDRDARLLDALEKLAGGVAGILTAAASLAWIKTRLPKI
jgi:VanZ family protein